MHKKLNKSNGVATWLPRLLTVVQFVILCVGLAPTGFLHMLNPLSTF